MLECNVDVAELNLQDIESLSSIASALSEEPENIEGLLQRYCHDLHHLCDEVSSSHYRVMQGLCSILMEGISSISDESRPLTSDECKLLKKIPSILFEYIDIPMSKIPDAHLLNQLKNPKWNRPVTEEEEKYFLHELMHECADDTCEDEPESLESSIEESNTDEVDLSLLIGSPDLDQDVELGGENEDEVLDLGAFVTGLDVSETGEAATTQELSVDVSDDNEVLDLSAFADNVSEINPAPDAVEELSDLQQKMPDENQPDVEVTDSHQELIDLVKLELDEFLKDHELINVQLSADKDVLTQQLLNIAEQVENIGNAVELIDLHGLGLVVRNISCNIHDLALSQSAITDLHAGLISKWPSLILSYLNNIAAEDATSELIEYASNEQWPDPLSAESIENAQPLLLNPVFEEEVKESRQNSASIEDVSINLPENVNQELLDGLLQDLPLQAEEFSSSIQNLYESQDLEYLEIAQRIAHTLKGAGNVVGVKGIANLTHHLEDILEIQTKAKKVPSVSLLDVLTDAADCLESMSEALMGIDEPPDNALQVFQAVLDWANKIDTEGATEYSASDDTSASIKVTDSQKQGAIEPVNEQEQHKNVVNIENMLRVPVKLADDLLRIAGENLISTSQIQEYIKIIQSRYRNLKVHNQSLQQLSFDLEHIVDVQGIASNTNRHVDTGDDFDPLEMDQYHELHSMSRRLVEIAADAIELTQVLEKDLSQLHGLVITQDQLQKENEGLVLRTRMVSTKTIIARLKRGVKQACRLTGKQVELDVSDNDTYMDSDVLNGMIEPLMHILRNAVDHGIETTDERKASDKPVRGLIKLTFSRRGEQIVIDVNDDGKGLDLIKIREKALVAGMVTNENEITENNLQKYILHPGFTTREQVSQVSGRGIGLDVVNTKIRELKGTLDVSSKKGKGTIFSLALPVSSFSTHSLLVRVRNSVYAISNRGVEEILYPGLGELQDIGNETMFKMDDQLYPSIMVESLLNLPEDRRDSERSARPVILLKDDSGSTTAVMVQEVIDSRDVVVKSMGPYFPKLPGIVGATVLGDGGIATVIDLPELLHTSSGLTKSILSESVEMDSLSSSQLPYVLVVDDSLSARKSLAQFVEDLGLDVRTARDGMEAVSLIDARKPDLILVDMEMPRMNGLELTSHIRGSENTQDMPVIMITSRSTDKHRKTAMDKGVDHYMVKPFAEDELASHINTVLKIA